MSSLQCNGNADNACIISQEEHDASSVEALLAQELLKRRAAMLRLMAGSSIGTILEWYDFSLFAYLTPTLSILFFPHENPLLALMLTYAVFAVGYLVRPLGSILFGHFGDRWGRKKTLVGSILLMSLPTFSMGLLPTYAQIGLAAPILLIFLRIIQGIAAGGESTGAVLFVLESVPNTQRGFYGALIWAMVGVGMLLGSFAATCVTQAETVNWAWRVPFLLGLLTGIVGYFLRRTTGESLLFTEVLRRKTQSSFPLIEGFKKYKQSFGFIIGLYMLSAMITYLIFVFMPTYATHILGFQAKFVSRVSNLAFLVVTLLVPVGGYISDRIGKIRCVFWASLGFIVFSYPLYKWMGQGQLDYFIWAQMIFVGLAASFQGALNAIVFDLIPTEVRYSMVAMGYNISYSLFGGTAPFVATYLVQLTGNIAAPGWYLMLGGLVAFGVVVSIKIRKRIENKRCLDFKSAV